MTAAHRAVLEAQGSALRFDQPVTGQAMQANTPVIVNTLETTERVAAGLVASMDGLDGLTPFSASLRSPVPPEGLRAAMSRWPILKAVHAT